MKKKRIYIIVILFVHISFLYAQQISTDNTEQPNALIQNLVGINCANASNVSSAINGSANNIISYGSFNSDGSNFPLQNGLVLSTGRVNSAGNVLNTSDLNEGNIDWSTDSDILDVLGIDQTLNATSIEFDFTSVNNFVSFKYLFASDEYQQEYPCNFKDVFAILIKRTDSNEPYINIALLPDATTEISTNTIHPNITGFCDAQNEDYFGGYNIGDTNFNGRTEVLNARADIIPNEPYHIKLLIADHIDERFDSAVFIEAEGFGSAIDLGPDQTICGTDLTLNANINNVTAFYNWFLNGNPIAGENNPTLQVNQSGNYEVEITIPSTNNNCTLSDAIAIEITPYQDASSIEDWSVCDPEPSDGIYNFDFTLKNDEIYSNLPSTNYTIGYYTNLEDAENGNNPIIGNYQNTEATETIFVRIQSLAGDCLQLGNFDIIINTSPNTLEYTIAVCNGFVADIRIANITSLDFPVSNYEFNTTVSYYLTEDDAINQVNVLETYPSLVDQPPYMIGRVEDDFNGCFSLVRVYFDYQDSPDLGIDKYVIDTCLDPDFYINDGTDNYNYNTYALTYNLEDAILEVQETYPGADVRILALIPGNPRTITVTTPTSASVPIGISFDGTYCEAVVSLELHKNLLFNLLGRDNVIYRCDDPSNDGIVDFNLAEIAEELKGGYDIDLKFYTTEADRASNSNELDQNTLFSATNSQTVYIDSFHKDCSLFAEVTLNIYPALNVPPKTVDYCGNTDPNTNATNIVLEPLIATVFEGLDFTGPVQFYLSEDDAENQENELADSYDIIGNQQLFYIRVTNVFTRCYDVTTLQVNITNAINASNPEPLIICDDNQDGVTTVNLENVIPQLSDGTDGLIFTFFETYDNAVENEAAIINPNNYTTTTTNVFIRAEILEFGCFTIFPFDVFVYSNPQLNTISTYINCEVNPNLSSEFLFVDKDPNIINGQVNMQVLYFETEDNAINRVNPIDKNASYIPISNPQTIFVRLENEAGNSCFKVAPMQIEVRQAPIFNNPTDIFECDINKTGFATTDLNEKISQIIGGSTTDLNITFHLTPLNAQIGANETPLNFTATSNPQILYARVLNTTTGCFETPAFSLNTLSLPEVTDGHSLTKCANNFEFYQQWNLTEIELAILQGRQYNIAFSYFESEADLLADNNPIVNPQTYTNTSNPQTLYAKITNATTGCSDSVSFQLLLNGPPPINDFETFDICENPENEIDLSEINGILLNNTFNVIIDYYATEADAEAKENPLNTDYTYTNTTETLFARIEYSTTNCYAVYPFQLVINALPIANQPSDLETCDDDFDGFATFDLTQQNSTILGNQNPNEFSITFYNSELNANENINQINSIYEAQNGEIIFVRLENNITGCYAVTQFPVVILPIPIATISDQVICLNDLPLLVSVETNDPSDTYLWSTNDTSSAITIVDTGTYYVTITNQFGCQNTSTFNVTESESAIIDVVESIDFSDPNNITVTIIGIGNYLYQLNNGNLQTSNVFQNVPIGYNSLTILDQNGCASITKEVLVIDAPKHMSPNNDGAFDTWHITGVETLPGTVINIFNRKGKLLTQLKHNSLGWDGTYKGNKMPASDYWYVANVIQNGIQFQIKGHFSLRR